MTSSLFHSTLSRIGSAHLLLQRCPKFSNLFCNLILWFYSSPCVFQLLGCCYIVWILLFSLSLFYKVNQRLRPWSWSTLRKRLWHMLFRMHHCVVTVPWRPGGSCGAGVRQGDPISHNLFPCLVATSLRRTWNICSPRTLCSSRDSEVA